MAGWRLDFHFTVSAEPLEAPVIEGVSAIGFQPLTGEEDEEYIDEQRSDNERKDVTTTYVGYLPRLQGYIRKLLGCRMEVSSVRVEEPQGSTYGRYG